MSIFGSALFHQTQFQVKCGQVPNIHCCVIQNISEYWKLEDDILTEVTLACEDNIKFKAHFKVYVKDKTKTNNNEIMLNEDERDTIIE